jgi:hypothetical protein
MANCVYFRCIYRHIVDLDPGGTCAGVISFITTRIAYNIGQNAIIKDDKLTTVLFIVYSFGRNVQYLLYLSTNVITSHICACRQCRPEGTEHGAQGPLDYGVG